MISYGQLVIGPPGSGKTTYCEGMRQILTGLGRSCLVVNMDFANDWATKIRYAQETKGAICEFAAPDVDVRQFLTLEDIMETHQLGPNGALIYAYKKLAQDVQWLKDRIDHVKRKTGDVHAYLLLDMPGQVELYTIDPSLRQIMAALNAKDRGFRPVAVHLVDATLCTNIGHYIAALLVALSAQMTLSLPFLNVLTKVDLIKDADLADGTFDLEWFTRAEDLQYLLPVAHPAAKQRSDDLNQTEMKFAKYHECIIELVEDFSLTSFLPLNIQDKDMTLAVLKMGETER